MAETNKECRISGESFEVKELGKTNRKIINGYWVWWCYEHKQPLPWCEKDKVVEKIEAQQECINSLLGVTDGLRNYLEENDSELPPLAKKVVAKAEAMLKE